MSTVGDLKAALKAAINAATGLTSQTWSGEESAMTASKPAVYVHWSGSVQGENEIIGAVGYEYEPCFQVYFAVEDSTTDGDVQAEGYMQQVRVALTNTVIASLGRAQPFSDTGMLGKTEMCVGVHGGSYLYVQGWTIKTIF